MISLAVAWVTPWYYLTMPNLNFGQAYGLFCLIAYMGTGICYLFNVVLSKKWSLMLGVMFPALFGVMYSGLNPTYPQMSWPQRLLSYLSFGRYAYPLYIVMDVLALPDGFADLPSMVALSDYYGWKFTRGTVRYTALGLFIVGLLFRFGAFIVLMSTRGGKSFFQVVGEQFSYYAMACLGMTKTEDGHVKISAPGQGMRRRQLTKRASSAAPQRLRSSDTAASSDPSGTLGYAHTAAGSFDGSSSFTPYEAAANQSVTYTGEALNQHPGDSDPHLVEDSDDESVASPSQAAKPPKHPKIGHQTGLGPAGPGLLALARNSNHGSSAGPTPRTTYQVAMAELKHQAALAELQQKTKRTSLHESATHTFSGGHRTGTPNGIYYLSNCSFKICH